MAAVVAARAFWDRMRFSLPAANRLIEKEELDTIEDLRELDSKRCERIVGKTPLRDPLTQWPWEFGCSHRGCS